MSERGESCFPSTDTLAEETGLSKRSVISHLQTAQENGWIIRKVKGTNGQGWKRHEYLATIPTPSKKNRLPTQKQSEKGGEPPAPPSEKLTIRGERPAPPSEDWRKNPLVFKSERGEPAAPPLVKRGEPAAPPSEKNVVKEVHSSSSGLPLDTKRQKTSRRNGLDDEVSVIWSYFVEQYEKHISERGAKRLVPTKKRLSKIRARKREGYSDEELKRAVDGVMHSDFHRENGFVDIELICRDQAHVEQYLHRQMNGNGKKKSSHWERELPLI